MVEAIERKFTPLFKNYEELKFTEPSPRPVEFSKRTSEIYLCCNEFYKSYDLNEKVGVKPGDESLYIGLLGAIPPWN